MTPSREVNCYGLRLRVADTPVGRITWDEVEARKWRPTTYRAFDRFVRPDMRCVDAGAYIGTTALYLASKASLVFAFEPDPLARMVLLQNCALNHAALGDRIITSPYALAAHNGQASLMPHGKGWGTSLSSMAVGNDKAALDVRCLAFGDFLRSAAPIHFCKLILQGAEPGVLAAAAQALAEFKPTLLITVQPHFYADRAAGLRQVADVFALYRHVYEESGKAITLDELRAADWGERIFIVTDREWGGAT